MCGWNGNGQLGIGNFTNVNVPIPVSGLHQHEITEVACGWNHTMALTSTFYSMQLRHRYVCIVNYI